MTIVLDPTGFWPTGVWQHSYPTEEACLKAAADSSTIDSSGRFLADGIPIQHMWAMCIHGHAYDETENR